MTTTRLFIVGHATFCGEEVTDEAVSLAQVTRDDQLRPHALILLSDPPGDPAAGSLFRELVSLAGTCPVLWVGQQRPAHLPFKASWFSSSGEAEHIFHRTLTELDHLDFVYWTGDDGGPVNLPSVTGVQTVLFSSGPLHPEFLPGRPGTFAFSVGNQAGLGLGPDSYMRLVEIAPDGKVTHRRVDSDSTVGLDPLEGWGEVHSVSVAPGRNHGGLIRQVLEDISEGHGPNVAKLVSTAISGDVPPLRIPALP